MNTIGQKRKLAQTSHSKTIIATHQSGPTLKIVHCFSIACVAVALGLFAAGVSGVAVFMLGLSTVIELVGSAVVGKQTNDSER